MSNAIDLRHADAIANALGEKYDARARRPVVRPVISGPLGLAIPTEFRMSHGGGRANLNVAYDSWRISGDLYLTLFYELDGDRTTVFILDKKRHAAKHDVNYASWAMKLAHSTVLDYAEHFRDSIVGVWSRTGDDRPWQKLSLGE